MWMKCFEGLNTATWGVTAATSVQGEQGQPQRFRQALWSPVSSRLFPYLVLGSLKEKAWLEENFLAISSCMIYKCMVLRGI